MRDTEMADELPKTKGQRTQEKILEQALKLFGKNGFANTSMQMIAKACDLSQGAVMQHFSSKDRLLEAVRRRVTASNHDFVDGKIEITDDSYTSLRKHLIGNLDWAIRHPAEADVIVLTYETAFHDADYREIANGAVRLGTERIYRYILGAQRERQVSAKIDAEESAAIIHTFLVGIVVRTIATSRPARLSKPMEAQIDLFLEKILGVSTAK